MRTNNPKEPNNQRQSAANFLTTKSRASHRIVDNRPQRNVQRKLQTLTENSALPHHSNQRQQGINKIKPVQMQPKDGIAQFDLDKEDLEAMWEMSEEDVASMGLDDNEKRQLGEYRAMKLKEGEQAKDHEDALASINDGGNYKSWSYKGESYHINLKYNTYHITWESKQRIHYFFQGTGQEIEDKQPSKKERGQNAFVFSELPAGLQSFIKNNFFDLI